MSKRFFIIFAITLLLFGSLFAYKFFQINLAVSQMTPPPPPVVAATQVQQERWDINLTSVGSLTAVAGVAVNNEVSGLVKSIHFESGQTVKAGQLLLELDSSLDKAQHKSLLAELALAKIRFDRNAKMIEKHFVSQSEFDESKAAYEQAMAAVEASQKLIAKKNITAPFGGDLAIRQVNLGQYLPAGTAIVDLQQLTTVFVDFSIPERDFSKIRLGQHLMITVQAYPDTVQGEIVAISPEVDQESRNVHVRGEINNKDKKLKPGMFAQISVITGRYQDVLSLPDTAITFNPYGNSVFLIQDSDQGLQVYNRQIETGLTRNGRIEIKSGLNAGDRVVSAGQLKLRNAMVVKVDTQSAPGERP